MDLKKENGKYVFNCLPDYKNKFPLAKNEYLEATLTKCSLEIIDKLEIYPYRDEIDITKSNIKIYYFDVPTQEKYRIDIRYIIEYQGLFFKKESKKYWKIEVHRINSFYDIGVLTDEQSIGTPLSSEIEKIFYDNKINKKNIIEFLLKFNYTRYSKDRNLRIGGI